MLSAFLCLSATWHFRSVHGRLHSNNLFAVSAAGCCVLRNLTTSSFGGKEQTISLSSLQLTVQLPCLNVFSSFILPLRARQKRSFDDVSTVGAGAERGVNTWQANRSPQGLWSTKICAWLFSPTARPETSCSVLATPVVWAARVRRSMELSIGCVRRLTGALADRTRKVDVFLSNNHRFRSNFACGRSWAWPSRCTCDFSPKFTQTGKNWRFLPTARIMQNWHRTWSMCRDGNPNRSDYTNSQL